MKLTSKLCGLFILLLFLVFISSCTQDDARQSPKGNNYDIRLSKSEIIDNDKILSEFYEKYPIFEGVVYSEKRLSDFLNSYNLNIKDFVSDKIVLEGGQIINLYDFGDINLKLQQKNYDSISDPYSWNAYGVGRCEVMNGTSHLDCAGMHCSFVIPCFDYECDCTGAALPYSRI